MANKTNPLKLAIEFENKGTNLYLKLAKETKNKLAKNLFYYLAKEEVEHAKLFDEIYSQGKSERKWRTSFSSALSGAEKEVRKYFKDEKKAKLKKGVENISGYELAMKLERKSYETYRSLAEKSDNQDEKKFYNRLMEEEKKHLEALENVYFYLTGTGDWFEADESATWNWMNM